MSDAITFKVEGSPGNYDVIEYNAGVRVAWYLEKANANQHAAFFNNFYVNGRRAHGKCSKGHACDRDRIHCTPREFNHRASVILCADHAAEFA
jgi:hypothetical protein